MAAVETDLERVAGSRDASDVRVQRRCPVTDGLPLLAAWAVFGVMVLVLAVILTRGGRS
jgi:hypothetical protein